MLMFCTASVVVWGERSAVLRCKSYTHEYIHMAYTYGDIQNLGERLHSLLVMEHLQPVVLLFALNVS